MGIAHGFASTVILRAESPVDAGGFRQSNAFWSGLSVLNRSVGCASLGVALILINILESGWRAYGMRLLQGARASCPHWPMMWKSLGR
jgi:hypothetical protein